MKLDGRRSSGNVDDRRGKRVGKGVGLGIVGTLIVFAISHYTGINQDIIAQLASNVIPAEQTSQSYTPTPEEQQIYDFATKILASTEDVWSEIFAENGETYSPPKMVVFSGSTQSACGNASSSTGPFYCSADETVYIDLSFFDEMKNSLGAGGDFAYAYVIAHEVGHHVQYLLGTLDKVHRMQQQVSDVESNQLSVRLELQADFYAGVWAKRDNDNYTSLEDGDIEEGLNAATQIGDDRLQMEAQGYTVPDAFNHGTSQQRSRWLKRGLTTGNIADGDTFSVPYDRL